MCFMPRTKGSKNKPKTVTADFATQIAEKQSAKEALTAEIASITANIDTLKADLKVKKAVLKKAEKEVATLEAKKAKADPFYSGYYKNGKFDGKGIYDDLDSFKFGIWREGKLVEGIEKDIFVYSKENTLSLPDIYKSSVSDLKMITCISERVNTIETLNEFKNKFDIQKDDYIYVADLIYKNNKQYLSNIRTEQEFIYENQLIDMFEEPKG